MPHQNKSNAGSAVAAAVLLALLLMPMLYMLASGPVVWLMSDGLMSESTAEWLYHFPDQIAFRSPRFNERWQAYLNFWR